MNLEEINGKKLALLLISKDEKNEDDWAVFTGTAKWNGNKLILDRGKDKELFTVPDDVLFRVKRVDEDVKDTLLGAEYFYSINSRFNKRWCRFK